MKLGIISHTAHYSNYNDQITGFGPTVREINYLSSKFDKIIHAGILHEGNPASNSIPYTSENIQFIPLPETGGKNIKDKLKSLKKATQVIQAIQILINEVDVIQLRVPTGMANYLLPYLSFRKNKPFVWVKYAGNWAQKHGPLGYQFQRWWLKKNFLNSKVTINGKWNDQPRHCYTFENPCLDSEERIAGKVAIERKKYSGPLTACFIGRIEKEKGVERILDAIPVLRKKNIHIIHFIGDGPNRSKYEQRAISVDSMKLIFHGNLSRSAIPVILEQSHLLILPSTASEGFPKVIAEGANYGAIPVVSDISSIGQYISSRNGYVWNHHSSFTSWLEQFEFNPNELLQKSEFAYQFAEAFTFESYYNKLNKYILNDR